MPHRKMRKSALALMMVAGGLVAAAPALTPPASAQSATKEGVGPCSKPTARWRCRKLTTERGVGPYGKPKTKKGVGPCDKPKTKGGVGPCDKPKKR